VAVLQCAVAVEAVADTLPSVEELTSQRAYDESGAGGYDEDGWHTAHSVAAAGSEAGRPLSKRKRKAPAQPDEVLALAQVGGWVRLALG
jgi:hypothetical protein